jgi:dTDP-4-amino-4,6-dideoxygalactose transaminase
MNAGISPRRYFYPSLNRLDYVESTEMPISDDISARIMCLPLFHNLKKTDQDMILNIIKETLEA